MAIEGSAWVSRPVFSTTPASVMVESPDIATYCHPVPVLNTKIVASPGVPVSTSWPRIWATVGFG